MKRLNPKTSQIFKRGDIRDDGYVFYQYNLTKKTKQGFFQESWYHPSKYYNQFNSRKRTEKKNRAVCRARGAKRRAAKLKRRPKWIKDFFKDQVQEYFIMAKELEKVFPWKMHVDHHYPMQGKLISGLDVPWNLEILPWFENIKKGNKFDVEQEQPPSVSEGYYKNGKVITQLWPIPSTRFGQDGNNLDNNSGTVQGQNTDHSPQESSTDSLGQRSQEVEASVTLTRIENNGDAEPEIVRLYFGS